MLDRLSPRKPEEGSGGNCGSAHTLCGRRGDLHANGFQTMMPAHGKPAQMQEATGGAA
jgi:hypothetical protein